MRAPVITREMIGEGLGWETWTDILDVRDYDSLTTAIDAIGTRHKTLLIPVSLTVGINEIVPYNVTLWVPQGGRLNINTGIVVTIRGTIIAGNYQIFEGAGFTNTNQLPGENNICWYPGSSLNDKWDAMVNQWVAEYQGRTIYIPRTPRGDPAAINYYDDKYGWKLDGTLDIDGKCNLATIICDGWLYVETGSALTNAVVISSTDKIEDIFFPRGLKIDCNTAATNGLMIKGGSRIDFGGMLRVRRCTNGLVINTDTVSLSEIHFQKVYVGTWSGSAVILNGNNAAVNSVTIDEIQAQVTQSASCRVLEITGRVPDFVIGHVIGDKVIDSGTDDIQYGILVQATTDGAPAYYRSNIESAYFNYVGIALKTEDTSSGAALKIRNLNIGPIWASNCTTLAELGYLQECELRIVNYDDPITVGADCQDIMLITQKGISTNITDNGVRTRINHFGHIAGSAATPPTTGNWEIGEFVEVTADNKIYLKVQDTGVDVNDFIVLN